MRRLFVLALVPLPFATALVADGEAHRLPRAVVEARAGDLFLGALQFTRGRALDGEPTGRRTCAGSPSSGRSRVGVARAST